MGLSHNARQGQAKLGWHAGPGSSFVLRMPRLPILQTFPSVPSMEPNPTRASPTAHPAQGFHGALGPSGRFLSTRVGVRTASAQCYTEQTHRQEDTQTQNTRTVRDDRPWWLE